MKAEVKITEKGQRVELVIEPENDMEAISLGLWVLLDKNRSKYAALSFKGLLISEIYEDCVPSTSAK